MAASDPGPTSSYSDPIYDRLDEFVQALKRRWWFYLAAIVLVLAILALVHARLEGNASAAAAAAFARAGQARDDLERLDRLKQLAQDATADPYYRARAWIEITQMRLDTDDGNGAKEAAQKAVVEAKIAKDPGLSAAARLSLAATELQLQDADEAFADYQGVEGMSARLPVMQLEAVLGEARCQVKLGKRADAIATLEPLLTRSDEGAEQLLDLARVLYWNLKRAQAQGPGGASSSAAAVAPGGASTTAATAVAPTGASTTAAAATPAPASAPAPSK